MKKQEVFCNLLRKFRHCEEGALSDDTCAVRQCGEQSLSQYGDCFATPSCVRCREERLAMTELREVLDSGAGQEASVSFFYVKNIEIHS